MKIYKVKYKPKEESIKEREVEKFKCVVCSEKFDCKSKCLSINSPLSRREPKCVCLKCQEKIWIKEGSFKFMKDFDLCVAYVS